MINSIAQHKILVLLAPSLYYLFFTFSIGFHLRPQVPIFISNLISSNTIKTLYSTVYTSFSLNQPLVLCHLELKTGSSPTSYHTHILFLALFQEPCRSHFLQSYQTINICINNHGGINQTLPQSNINRISCTP